MGKNFCDVEKKWCKFLRHGICKYSNCPLNEIERCKRITDIKTVSFSELLGQVNFDDVFKELTHWFSDQESSEGGYREVFNLLLTKTPKRHRLDDLFIEVKKVTESDGEEWLNVSGINVAKRSKISYGIEFEPWDTWLTMFIMQETLDTLSKETIVAACLYEMTFFGFTEHKVQEANTRLINAVEEAKAERNG